MLKVHDDLVTATNELIKQTHVCHEKQTQRLEKEIRVKDNMNLIMQQVLINVIRSTQHFVDIPINKFNEVLLVIEETLDTLKAQAHTVDTYDKLSKQINLSFQRMFEKICDLKYDMLIVSKAGPAQQEGEKW